MRTEVFRPRVSSAASGSTARTRSTALLSWPNTALNSFVVADFQPARIAGAYASELPYLVLTSPPLARGTVGR
jgi:hypothetical protein